MHPLSKEFYSFWENVITSSDTPDTLMNIVIGLITIMVSVIVFIFTNDRQNNEAFEWEKVVLLDKVLLVKFLIIIYFISFIIVLIWNESNTFFKVLYFLFFLYGIGINLLVLNNTYRWFKTIDNIEHMNENSFRNKLRLEYLGEITDKDEKERVWSMTWKKTSPNVLVERVFVERFNLNLRQLLEEGDYKFFERYLSIFVATLDNRTLQDWIVFDNLITKILEFRSTIYTQASDQIMIKMQLTRIIRKLTEDALQKGVSFILFDKVKKHLDEKDKNYSEEFLQRDFCFAFFDHVWASSERSEIWEMYFDKKWFVTESNLATANNVAIIWANCYFRWAQPLFTDSEQTTKLAEVTEHLFSDVYPPDFSMILTFLTRPWSNNRYQDLISSPPFYVSPRIFSGSYSDFDEMNEAMEERDINQKRATSKLVVKMFPGIFNSESLKKIIEGINSATPKNEEQKYLHTEYLRVFTALKNNL